LADPRRLERLTFAFGGIRQTIVPIVGARVRRL